MCKHCVPWTIHDLHRSPRPKHHSGPDSYFPIEEHGPRASAVCGAQPHQIQLTALHLPHQLRLLGCWGHRLDAQFPHSSFGRGADGHRGRPTQRQHLSSWSRAPTWAPTWAPGFLQELILEHSVLISLGDPTRSLKLQKTQLGHANLQKRKYKEYIKIMTSTLNFTIKCLKSLLGQMFP